MPPTPQPFVRSVLSEPDGTGSTARVCTTLVVVAAILWVSFLTLTQRVIPDLTGVTVWVTTVSAALYGTNKVVTARGTKGSGQ